MNPRILVIDPDEGHRHAIAGVLSGTGGDIRGVAGVAGVDDDDVDLVLASYDGIGAAGAASLLRRFSSLRARGRVLLFVGSVDRPALAALFGEHGLSNVLARTGALDVVDLEVTVGKILRGDVFGIDRYFPVDAARESIVVRGSLEREALLVRARDFALGVGAQGRFADLLCNACDEMLTNALYNAPVDGAGAPRFAHLSRAQAVQLADDEAVTVTLCSDGKEMGIAVSDPFGSLKAATITQYLAKCLRRGSDLVDDKEGGAGLGLFYVFEAVSHFVVNLAAGRCTEMIGILDVRGRYKDFVSRPKSFNVFVAAP